ASFFFASRRRHTRLVSDWSSDVCSSDLRCPFACRGRATRSASNFCNIRNRCCAISARTQARKQRQRERHEMDSGEVTKLGCALLLLALAAVGAARADEPYPTRPIRLVVGFGAGGPTDIPARFVADKLGEALGQRVVVENKPAAAGMIATRDVLSQPRDGYTLLLCTHFDPINTVLYKNAQFKLNDLAPVSLIAKYYYGLALANAVPADDFKAFVQYAKAHPGEVSYATIGAGSAQEILARQLEKLTGIAMNRIPFRGGAQVVQEVVAGRVHFYVSPTLAIVPQYQAKQLKILAV